MCVTVALVVPASLMTDIIIVRPTVTVSKLYSKAWSAIAIFSIIITISYYSYSQLQNLADY